MPLGSGPYISPIRISINGGRGAVVRDTASIAGDVRSDSGHRGGARTASMGRAMALIVIADFLIQRPYRCQYFFSSFS